VLDEQSRRTANDINAKFAKSVVALHLDVTRAADWRATVDACQREFGGPDVLVNNAGILDVKGIEDTSEDEWDSVVNINQKGVWLGMKAAVPAMRRQAVNIWAYPWRVLASRIPMNCHRASAGKKFR